ncbi:MAG: WYL domain-containing protein [Bacteroidales bacterium]|nr:WYL domain-containing protein [Bacteroidales bacterium]
MKTAELLKEYIWIVQTIKRYGKISFDELNDRWLDTTLSDGAAMPRTTFNRHRESIEELFGLRIECDSHDGYKYYISNQNELSDRSIANWIYNTMSVSVELMDNHSIKDRILLENVPSGNDFLHQIVEAMKNNNIISVKYQRYNTFKPKDFRMAPYCVKLWHQRWYVLCKLDNGNMGIFSLDRMRELSVTTDKFEIDSDFDAEAYFRDCYGIAANVFIDTERIVVRAFEEEAFYIRDLPMHHTQRVVAQTEEYTDYEIQMRPTIDFSEFLVSRYYRVKVLEPQWLANEVYNMHLRTLEMYDADEEEEQEEEN